MALGVPIAYSLLLCGVALMVYMGNFDAQILAQNLIEGANSFPLLAVPFFMLAGEIMNVGGLSRRIIHLALTLVGHVRGGLGYVVIVAACMLAALSGSAVADAAALAAMLLPMMVKAGHDKRALRRADRLSRASSRRSFRRRSPSSFSALRPTSRSPSCSWPRIVPGLLMGVAIAIAWHSCRPSSENATPPAKATGAEKMKALRDSTWALVLPFIVLVGLKCGRVHADRGGCGGGGVRAVLAHRGLPRDEAAPALRGLSSRRPRPRRSIMFLVAAAMVSAWLITVASLPQQLIALLTAAPRPADAC